MSKKIEILMATYNGGKYLEEQLDSIVAQTYKNWKLLISDDGSEDNTLKIIKKYSKKHKNIVLVNMWFFVRLHSSIIANNRLPLYYFIPHTTIAFVRFQFEHVV